MAVMLYSGLVLAIPHSVSKPADLDWTSDKAVMTEVERWTDWHTDKLFGDALDVTRVIPVLSKMSRFDCDCERLEREQDRINRYRMVNKVLVSDVLDDAICTNRRLAEWYRYRFRLMEAASVAGPHPLIVDCHSFHSDLAPDTDICIGFNEDATKPPQEVLDSVDAIFRDSGYAVEFNRPYSNSIAPVGYVGHSIMIEVNKRSYLADVSAIDVAKFNRLQQTIRSVFSLLLSGSPKP